MDAVIRPVVETDADSMLTIYTPIVRNSAISFEVEPPTRTEMRERIAITSLKLPWLVCAQADEIAGYAYASPHRTRAAYQWSVDVSAYVHPQWHRRGIGQALYRTLFEILRLQGYYNAFAGISLPNDASIEFHRALGFEPVGVYRDVGYKLGAWHDVSWWQLSLQPREGRPAPIRPFRTLEEKGEVSPVLAMGTALLQGHPPGGEAR